MSLSQSAPSATLPRGFRYDQEFDPRTPEPCAPNEELALPSPPARPRLRLKRRNVSQQLNAPTQQFLASVAAADIPIPSVENPEFATNGHEVMMESLPEVQVQVEDYDGMDIYQHIHPRTFSPPKTPAVDVPAALPPLKYPDWSVDSDWGNSDMDSGSDCESSRPSTAFSTQTSASLFSRYSMLSDDESEPDTEEPAKPVVQREGDVRARKPRKAPWTKAMTAHLWSTYMLYLQDPKVTPIRLGKSCIPPHGVCLRVAREAKRSWKGSNLNPVPTKSGNSTPMADASRPFVQWPHTCAATRTYLRELCRLKATSKAGRRHLMSRSPTPFNRAAHRRWNRRNTPGRSPSIFSSSDMNMSLTMSTSETMQPYGPLAQLASSQMEPFPDLVPSAKLGPEVSSVMETSVDDQARLGSPFTANSYGPSSSSSLGANLNLPKQSNSVGSRKLLKSPVRLTRSRSGTQKRRSAKATEDPPRKRPSLSAAFGKKAAAAVASDDEDEDVESPQQQIKPSSTSGLPDDPFQTDMRSNSAKLTSFVQPLRLGSPFSGSSSMPTRSSAPINLNFRRPFATLQQPTQRTSETPPTRSSLASRLAYLDQRLRDFRNRRRSQSPM